MDVDADSMWWALIAVSLKYRKRIGRFRGPSGRKLDRMSVYICCICYELAGELLREGALVRWKAGLFRLQSIYYEAADAYHAVHGSGYTAPARWDE